MANSKILEKKQEVINEIVDKVKNNASIVLFDYQGITDAEIKELRIKLRESGSDFKVFKNTLMARAFNSIDIDFNNELTNDIDSERTPLTSIILPQGGGGGSISSNINKLIRIGD